MTRKIVALLGAGLAMASSAADNTTKIAPTPLPSIEVFFAEPEFESPKLSPDGTLYAVKGTRDKVRFLATIDVATRQVTPVTTFPNAALVDFWWKGRDRILLLAEGPDGSRYLRAIELNSRKITGLNGNIEHLLPNEPNHVLVSGISGMELHRLDLRTGKSIPVQRNPGGVQGWVLAPDARVLAGVGRTEKIWFMILPKTDGTWRRVELGSAEYPTFYPYAAAPGGRRILCRDYFGADTQRLVAWDPENDSREVLFESPEADVAETAAWGGFGSRMRTVRWSAGRWRIKTFDPKDQALMEQIDAALPDSFNEIVSTSDDELRLIVSAQVAARPEGYYLLDRTAGKIIPLGTSHSKLHPAALGHMEPFAFTARDGTALMGHIVIPPGAKGPVPAIVIAGLASQLGSNFQRMPQILASRGYATVAICHRGVVGLGSRHAAAGNMQVRGRIADDIADGVRALIDSGRLDARRIAVLGAYQNGLVGLHLLDLYPDLFAVWVNFGTPMAMSYYPADNFVFGLNGGRPPKEVAGGTSALADYTRTLDPMDALPRIRLPSFHYYPRDPVDNTITNDGQKIQRHLAKTGLPHVFLRGSATRTDAEFFQRRWVLAEEDSARVSESLLQFLSTHLGAKN